MPAGVRVLGFGGRRCAGARYVLDTPPVVLTRA